MIVSMIGLDGHTTGAEVVSMILRDAGLEVVYLGVNQTPEMITHAAIQEGVDLVDISSHASNYAQIEALVALLRAKGAHDVPVVCGGNIPPHIAEQLKAAGVAEIFAPGTSGAEIVDRIPPMGGDEIQAAKAGITEIGDIYVVNKGDHPDADRTVHLLEDMLALAERLHPNRRWRPPVVKAQASSGEGVAALAARISERFDCLQAHPGLVHEQRRARAMHRVSELMRDMLEQCWRRSKNAVIRRSGTAQRPSIEHGLPTAATDHCLLAASVATVDNPALVTLEEGIELMTAPSILLSRPQAHAAGKARFLTAVHKQRLRDDVDPGVGDLIDAVARREIEPHTAASALLARIAPLTAVPRTVRPQS